MMGLVLSSPALQQRSEAMNFFSCFISLVGLIKQIFSLIIHWRAERQQGNAEQTQMPLCAAYMLFIFVHFAFFCFILLVKTLHVSYPFSKSALLRICFLEHEWSPSCQIWDLVKTGINDWRRKNMSFGVISISFYRLNCGISYTALLCLSICILK